MVFFVLSGYFISASVLRDRVTGRWSWTKYSVSRLTRLYLVLVPGLLLTILFDGLGLIFFPDSPVYSGAVRGWHHDFFAVADRLSVVTFMGNLMFLQTVVVPSLGSNEPLWSLSYEFWYYVLFPLGCLAFAQRTQVWARVACLVVCAILLGLLGKSISLYFPVWLLGTAIVLIPPIPRLTRTWTRTAVAVAVSLFGAS